MYRLIDSSSVPGTAELLVFVRILIRSYKSIRRPYATTNYPKVLDPHQWHRNPKLQQETEVKSPSTFSQTSQRMFFHEIMILAFLSTLQDDSKAIRTARTMQLLKASRMAKMGIKMESSLYPSQQRKRRYATALSVRLVMAKINDEIKSCDDYDIRLMTKPHVCSYNYHPIIMQN